MRTAPLDERVMAVVGQAAQHPPEERAQFLRTACAGDDELFQASSEQLQWQEKMGGFLLRPLAALIDFDRPFKAGQIVSGRFQVVREIGEGGMGIVYEAFDVKRQTRIAIKAAKAGYQRLLTPELAGALQVRHPNVCLVNEIHTATTPEGEIDFLTMELLTGETLRDRLRADGKLPPHQAIEIARQLCAGLREAHRCGVIHRDLKSSNVLLTHTPDGKVRAVITDFGLAGGMSVGASPPAGTPAYMAPELWGGQQATQASDIYALGVILYESVVGLQPFEHDSSYADQPPESPSSLIKGLDKRWDAAILPCLAFDPRLRPADPARIVAGFEKSTRSRVLYALAGAVLIACSMLPVGKQLLQYFYPPTHIRLAVLPFTAPPDANAQIGGVLQDVMDRLRRRQSGGSNIVLIPPSEAVFNGVKNPSGAAKILHATHALQGEVSRDGPDLVAQADLVDAQTQTSLSHFSQRYSPSNAAALPKALAGAVSLALRLQGEAPPEKLSTAASGSYLRALYFLRRDGQSFDEAIPLLIAAARADPGSPLPWASLTEAMLQKVNVTGEKSWLSEAQRYYNSAATLDVDSVRVRLVGGMLNDALGRHEKAVADYSRVLEIDPQNANAFGGLARVYDSMDMPDKAIAAYQKAIQLEPGYYAPYQNLGVYYYYRGKFGEAAHQFQNAINRAPGLVRGYTNLGASLNDLGRDAAAEQAFTASLHLKITASALNGMGAIRTYQKRDLEASRYYERAQQLEPRNFVVLMNLADSYRRMGHRSEAYAAYRRAMDAASGALQNNPRRGYTRAFVGYLAARLGDRRRAEDEIGQALQFSPSDQQVIRESVLAYEALGYRDRSLDTLRAATSEMIGELARQPDLQSLQSDPGFLAQLKRSGEKQQK